MDHCADTSKKARHGSVDDLEYRGATSAWENIIVDPDLVLAHAALPAVDERGGESTHLGSTTQLPERVSIPVNKPLGHMESHDSACMFDSNAETSPSSDVRSTADYVTDTRTVSDLERAVNDVHHPRELKWLELEQVDVEDRNDAGMVQFRSYITTLKIYRPDLPTGLYCEDHRRLIMLVPFDTCNILILATGGAECDNLYPADIAALYLTSDRDPALRFNAQQADLVRCDVLGFASLCRLEYQLTSSDVARAPGRIPFATSQIPTVPISTGEAGEAFVVRTFKGFCLWKEREKDQNLPQSLRNKGWLPGFVHLQEIDDVHRALTVFALTKPYPCILAPDLNRALEDKLLRERPNAQREPMIIELSDYSARQYPARSTAAFKRAIMKTNDLPADVLRLAFPDDDNDFLTQFLAVMETELKRYTEKPLPALPVHNPRHDAESAFWVFFWAAARALHRDASLEPPSAREIRAFNAFCNTMFDQVIDEDEADWRDQILQAASFARLFSPLLRPFVELFETMAHYLNVPWHIYEATGQVKPDHAHVAFRRLLLRFILDLEKDDPAMLRIRLIEHSRVSALPASCESSVRTSGLENMLYGCSETGGNTSRKRKANEPADTDVRPPKRTRREDAATSETAQLPTLGSAARCTRAPDYGAAKGEAYNESDPLDAITVPMLPLKF